MNKYFKIKLGSFLITVIALLVYSQTTHLQEQLVIANETISSVETAGKEILKGTTVSGNAETVSSGKGKYIDGTYEGTGAGFGGDITVSVTISEGLISEVKILSAKEEDQAYLDMAKSLTSIIVSQQSTTVDVVSGATFSSKGILEAVNKALEKAV